MQQATAQVLDWTYDRDFSDRSFGFRRNMRAHHALRVITAEADQGYRWAVDMDLANDNVPVPLQIAVLLAAWLFNNFINDGERKYLTLESVRRLRLRTP